MYLRFFANLLDTGQQGMGRHKDGKLEPWSKAQDDRPAFEKYKKARQDMHPRFSQQE